MALALLGIIIGASGLGFGAYSTMQVETGAIDGENGDDGDDGSAGKDGTDWQVPPNVHYCSSQTEIEDSLDTIGMGHGTIIITDNITLSSQIDINDGGNYIIRGASPVTIDRNANDETFNITNVQSLTLKDLIIDTNGITSISHSGIHVSEGNNNPVYIQNVQIGGGDSGVGIYVNSENVWIENCIIETLRYGIFLDSSSAYCHILDNSLRKMNPSSGNVYGIFAYHSKFNTISGNIVNTIKGSASAVGIRTEYSDFNTISGNIIDNIYGNSPRGFYIYRSDNNTISGNVVYNISSSDGNSIGITIGLSEGNIVTDNKVNMIITSVLEARGISLSSCGFHIISGNVIRNVQALTFIYGIKGELIDYNVIIGNVLNNCGLIDVTGVGNVIIDNVEVP